MEARLVAAEEKLWEMLEALEHSRTKMLCCGGGLLNQAATPAMLIANRGQERHITILRWKRSEGKKGE